MNDKNDSKESASIKKLLFVVNVDWSFLSHRLPIALAAQKCGYEVHLAAKITLPIESLRQHNLIVHPLPLSRSKGNLIQIFRECAALVHIFRKLRPDIVHLVTIKPVLFGGIAARIAKVPAVVIAISGLGFVFIRTGFLATIKRSIVSFLYKIALKHRNVSVIFQNNDDFRVIQQATQLSSHQAVFIRGCGVNLEQYQPQAEPERPLTIVLAARLIADKGVREFIEAARVLKKSDSRFVLVGDIDSGNPSSLTQEEVQSCIDEEIVEYWGHCQDMAEVFSRCHIVVLPSYREGFPKVLMEAAACGKPIITTDVPGCRDAIVPNHTGLMIPKKDAQALARAIDTLVKDPLLCSQMRVAARQFAEAHFSVEQIVQHHLAVYAQRLSA